ncbi:alanine racemase [Occallatibacter savannae]|uniref:alanine racemase n=1 Tax=Occallatibacter savannae TaxID=1002691 RepID=UPI000D687B54|nr:alanine racemase [Occallatibacter savannae]
MQTRPCWVEISTRAFEDNCRLLSKLANPHVDLLAIVKANAYGHSLAVCGPAAVRAGINWLGVTSVEEGIEARRLCPDARILVISGAFPHQGEDVVRNKLTAVVWDQWQFDLLEEAARSLSVRSISVHLELDTGMNRQGVQPDQLPHLLARFRRDFPLRFEGVMTHLFAADEADGRVTEDQLSRVNDALISIKSAGIHPGILNVGNSAALVSGQASNIAKLASRFEMKPLVRPGLALYGLIPEFDPEFSSAEPISLGQARHALKPVLTWKSQVVSVRPVQPGSVVGYNGTFVATEPMRLALIAVGYADGLDRKLGNHFSLLVRGQRAPIIGRISMDQTVLDVTEIPDVVPGDEVVLIGRQGEDSISAFDHAHAAGTVPWEILTRIAPRVSRVEI